MGAKVETSVRTLVITNDLPPRTGGIQTFLHEVLRRQDPSSIVVFGPKQSGSAQYDVTAGFEIHRHDGPIIPTPRVARRAVALARHTGAKQVMLGAGLPNAHLIPILRKHGLPTALVITHGNEAGWANLPGGCALMHPLKDARNVTYLIGYTRTVLRKCTKLKSRLHALSPGVDAGRFFPGNGGEEMRKRWGLYDRFVIGTVTRLVARKGVDLLIDAMSFVRQAVPDAVLLVVGDGPRRADLEKAAVECGVQDAVVFAGEVSDAHLPSMYDSMDVFALPTRTRKWGVDLEGLGIVFLEAAASGLPVLVGDSGGSVEAVRPGVTGRVVGTEPADIAGDIIELASNEPLRRSMGQAGRQWMLDAWQWDHRAARVSELLTAH